jgi:hypothetical protein
MIDPVITAGGKYTFFLARDGLLDCLRYGEPWSAFRRTGSHDSGSTLALYHKALDLSRQAARGEGLGVVWLVFRLEPLEGEDLLGVYATRTCAEARATAELERFGGECWPRDDRDGKGGPSIECWVQEVRSPRGVRVRIERREVSP